MHKTPFHAAQRALLPRAHPASHQKKRTAIAVLFLGIWEMPGGLLHQLQHALRRGKVHFTPLPPGAKAALHFLAPPLPTRPASLGSRGDPCAPVREDDSILRQKKRTAKPFSFLGIWEMPGGLLHQLQHALRRGKVHFTPLPPGAKAALHFLAPPLPTRPASLGSRGGPLCPRAGNRERDQALGASMPPGPYCISCSTPWGTWLA